MWYENHPFYKFYREEIPWNFRTFPRISARHRHGSVETDVVGTWTIGLHVTWPRNPMEEKADAFHVTETGDFTMKSGGLTWVKHPETWIWSVKVVV